jgi:hypothetical protein
LDTVIEIIPYTYRVSPRVIISAYSNPVNLDMVEEYARRMEFSEPPPISGYPGLIDVSDIGKEFLTGEKIILEHAGEPCWYVTDGHHRSLAAIWVDEPWLIARTSDQFAEYEEYKRYAEWAKSRTMGTE